MKKPFPTFKVVVLVLSVCGLHACGDMIGLSTPTVLVPKPPLSSEENTPTRVSHPTAAVVPTLSLVEAETRVREMLRNNGGCRLPCFLGFTPGQTDLPTMNSVLSPLSAKVDWGFETGGAMRITFASESISEGINVEMGLIADTGEDLSLVVKSMTVTMGVYFRVIYDGGYQDITLYDTPYYKQYFQYYTLPYLLANHGQPDQVYVSVDVGLREMGIGEDVCLLFLDYASKGWVAYLAMPVDKENNLYIRVIAQ